MPSPTLISLLTAALDTNSTLRLQLLNLQQALLAPELPPTPPSPDNTLLVLGGSPGSPTSITDTAGSTWTLQPNGASATPTLFHNGFPDPFTGPASLALYLGSKVYFQRITGQWHQWATNHWAPTTDPRSPTAPEWGLPAARAIDALDFSWLPESISPESINIDLLAELFTDNSPRASTFLPAPIPITIRPRGIPRPPIYQRSDNTFLIPICGPTTPLTIQFPGLRPTFIRLWSALKAQEGLSSLTRVSTGTDTIAVPSSRGSFHIIELSLG